jgi:hypothetical protein
MQLQKLVHIRQNFPDRALPDVSAAVRAQMESADWALAVKPGSRIAVGVGSRGITNIDVITKSVIEFWKSRNVQPFLIPVMGSHGSASAEGQASVLAHYGITEETMGAPVVSSLDVVPIGTTPTGIEVVMDRQAHEADGTMLLSRVKWHTDFDGKLESGIHKMMAIGLGKWAGAKRYHTFALEYGLEEVIRSAGKVMLNTGKMLGGLAILEDAYHSTAEVAAVGAEEMVEREEELLAKVKSWKPNIPVQKVDLLVVDEIGKNFSGAGMDTKIVNRSGRNGPNTWPDVPKISRIIVRDLSPLSYGNAIGIGLADAITDRLFRKVDFEAMYVNSLTASSPAASFTPMHFPSDRLCIEKIAPTCGKIDLSDVTIAWIRNSMDIGELMISEGLIDEVSTNSQIEVISDPIDLKFDSEDNLINLMTMDSPTH